MIRFVMMVRKAAENSRDRILSIWIAHCVWERLGRELAIITVMHWCGKVL